MRGWFSHVASVAKATLLDDTKTFQRVQTDEGPMPDGDRITQDVPVIHHFGFTSVPPLGSILTLLRRAGDRAQSMVLGSNDQATRLRELQPGDSALYDVRGAKVTLTENGLLIDCAGLPAIVQNTPSITLHASASIMLDAPNVECTGNFKADKLLTGDGTPIELGTLRDAYNAHAHTGVAAGSAATGPTDHTV